MAITVINENDYIRDSREVINNNFNELDTLKAPLNSPALTGTPTAPTPTGGDNSTKIATTAYVEGEVANCLPLSGGSLTGNLSVSGTITGNVTGNVTGNADTATNATNDANGNPITGTYLPLAGGTLTGDVSASADLSVAGDTSLTNLSVSGTTALNGNSTAITQPIDDNSTKIATTEYVQAEIKPIEADVSANDKRISNIEKLLQGNLYDYQTDTDSAYTKTVPQGAMPYASLEQIGGKTLVFNQLVNPANIGASKTQNGITFTNNGDGSVTVSGTATGGNAGLSVLSPRTWADHKYCLQGCPSGGSSSTYCLRLLGQGNNYFDTGDGVIWYHATARYKQCDIVVYEGTAIDTPITFKPQFIDLTLMFGAGNEPTTVEQFREIFPASYYPYNAGTLLSAGAESVKSRGENLADGVDINTGSINSNTGASNSVSGFCRSNYVIVQPNTQYYIKSMGNGVNRVFEYTADSYIGYTNSVGFIDGVYFTTSPTTYRLRFNFFADEPSEITDLVVEKHINSYPIPTPIQQLDGYGWSAGNVYNYIDYERKVFVKNVGAVDLGTLNWVSTTRGGTIQYFYTISLVDDMWFEPNSNTAIAHIVCPKYTIGRFTDVYNNTVQCMGVGGGYGNPVGRLAVYDASSSSVTAEQYKSSLSGVMLYYQLKTPIETDISAYLSDDNLIEVESGGTLTFPNSNGDDYRIPVPSKETYMINLQEAVSNG